MMQVTMVVTSPLGGSFLSGLGVSFNLGAGNKLDEGAVVQDVTAVHVSLHHSETGKPSVSTQIAVLRRLLLQPSDGDIGEWFGQVKAVRSIVSEA